MDWVVLDSSDWNITLLTKEYHCGIVSRIELARTFSGYIEEKGNKDVDGRSVGYHKKCQEER